MANPRKDDEDKSPNTRNRKSRLDPGTPQYGTLDALPPAPAPLSDASKRYFENVGNALLKSGLLTSGDVENLTLAAGAYGDVEFWRVRFEESKGLEDFKVLRDTFAAKTTAEKLFLQYSAKLGTNPKDRSTIRPPKAKTDDFAALKELLRDA
jgi:hypothetical protein